MRIAVVQILPSSDRADDERRLAALLADACSRGATLAALPFVPSLAAEAASLARIRRDAGCGGDVFLLGAPSADAGSPPLVRTPLGSTMVLIGDDAIDPALHALVREEAPDALLLHAQPESPLQAEAVLELAVGYSTSLAGLVLVSAATTFDPNGEAFGCTAIVQHGEILAEAVDPEDVIFADVDPPVRLQQPVSGPPEPQPILAQRLAHHQGRKAPVDWLADLD